MPILTPPRDRIAAFIDSSAERIGEVVLLAALAIAKGWNRYADRREAKRAGRRATDRQHANVARQIARLEQLVAELTTATTRLTARVRALERVATKKED